MAGKLNKEQCLAELRRLGEDVPTTWSLPEIRGCLTQKWNGSGHKRILRTDVQFYGKLKRGELEVMCDKHDIPVTKGDSKSSLIYKLMQNDRMEQPATGQDFLGFGKFGSRTYEDVRDTEPHYCRWVLETMDSESSKDLRRFGRWLMSQATGSSAASAGPQLWPAPPPPKAGKGRQQKPTEKYHIGSDKDSPEMNVDEQRGQKTKERVFEKDPVKNDGQASSSQMNNATTTQDVNLQLLHAMQNMMERMANLELRVSQSESSRDGRSDFGSVVMVEPPEPEGSAS